MPTPEQLQEWNKVFTRIERVDDYQKLKKHLTSIENQIEQLKEDIENFRPPRNPKEDIIQQHDKTTCRMLIKQKARMEQKLGELAKQIKADVEESKKDGII